MIALYLSSCPMVIIHYKNYYKLYQIYLFFLNTNFEQQNCVKKSNFIKQQTEKKYAKYYLIIIFINEYNRISI